MGEVLVVADDLTGANATAAGFARTGLRAVSVGAGWKADSLPALAARFDVVVACLDSRHSPAEEAARRASAAVRAGWPARLVCNRVDTTLRGNLGASTAAVLRTVSELCGRRAVALCAPAHPAAGRQTVEGVQLLDGRRLEETELARDPRSPVDTSNVAAVIRMQEALRTAHVPLSAVTGEPDRLRAALRQVVRDGADVVIADALTVEHLQRIADAAAAADDVQWVAVDPGPGSLALAGALGITGKGAGAPLLAVSGSATALTRHQLARLVSEQAVTVVRPVADRGGTVPDAEATAADLIAALDSTHPAGTVLLATAIDESDVRRLAPGDAGRVPLALAAAARRVLEQRTVDGLYATGGDVTAAVVSALGAAGVEVADEVVPLAVAGTLVGGPWDGLPMVTKGGLVGDADTGVECLRHLRRTAEARRHHVRAAR